MWEDGKSDKSIYHHTFSPAPNEIKIYVKMYSPLLNPMKIYLNSPAPNEMKMFVHICIFLQLYPMQWKYNVRIYSMYKKMKFIKEKIAHQSKGSQFDVGAQRPP